MPQTPNGDLPGASVEKSAASEKTGWDHIDSVAETHLKEMIDDLNAELGNLLIFAALFSAINTSFLIYTLPNLNSSSSPVTHAMLLVNELWSASLTTVNPARSEDRHTVTTHAPHGCHDTRRTRYEYSGSAGGQSPVGTCSKS